jgi:hypothetical protein
MDFGNFARSRRRSPCRSRAFATRRAAMAPRGTARPSRPTSTVTGSRPTRSKTRRRRSPFRTPCSRLCCGRATGIRLSVCLPASGPALRLLTSLRPPRRAAGAWSWRGRGRCVPHWRHKTRRLNRALLQSPRRSPRKPAVQLRRARTASIKTLGRIMTAAGRAFSLLSVLMVF